jgi:hypothetical protein
VQVSLDVLNSKPMQTGSLQYFDYGMLDSETTAFFGPNLWSNMYYNSIVEANSAYDLRC